MTKTSMSLMALILMAACSAAASPAVVAATAQSNAAPVTQAASTPIATALPSAPAASHAPTQARPMSCDVRSRATANGVLLEAVAHAERAFSGAYELVITERSHSGSSDVTQGGPVDMAAGETVTLGSTELSANGRYSAVLTLRDGGGAVCRLERQT